MTNEVAFERKEEDAHFSITKARLYLWFLRRYHETQFFDLVSFGQPVKSGGVPARWGTIADQFGILPITLKMITR